MNVKSIDVFFPLFSLFVLSLSAGLLAGGFAQFLGLHHWLLFALNGSSATFVLYYFLRFNLISYDGHDWYHFFQKFNVLSVFWLIQVIYSVSFFLFLGLRHWEVMFCIIIVFTLLLLYLKPIVGIPLREHIILKPIILSIVWTMVICIIPISVLKIKSVFILDIFRCFFMFFALSLPFDIRDISVDQDRMKTLPIAMGVTFTKYLCVFFYMSTRMLSFDHFTDIWSGVILSILALFLYVTAIFTLKKRYYFLFDVFLGLEGMLYILH